MSEAETERERGSDLDREVKVLENSLPWQKRTEGTFTGREVQKDPGIFTIWAQLSCLHQLGSACVVLRVCGMVPVSKRLCSSLDVSLSMKTNANEPSWGESPLLLHADHSQPFHRCTWQPGREKPAPEKNRGRNRTICHLPVGLDFTGLRLDGGGGGSPELGCITANLGLVQRSSQAATRGAPSLDQAPRA